MQGWLVDLEKARQRLTEKFQAIYGVPLLQPVQLISSILIQLLISFFNK
jgi:hypothetical protein